MTYVLGAAATAASVRPDIRLGSKGKHVTEAQEILRALTVPGDMLKVTGVFDADTKEATQQFQAANGLKVDGVIGPKTWSALLGRKVLRPRAQAQTKKKTVAAPLPEPSLPTPPPLASTSPSSPWPLIAGVAAAGIALLFFMRK